MTIPLRLPLLIAVAIAAGSWLLLPRPTPPPPAAPEAPSLNATWLLSPLPPRHYFEQYHSKRILHLKRAAYFYDPLRACMQNVEALLATQQREHGRPELRHPQLGDSQAKCNLVMHGIKDLSSDYVDVFHGYLDGCTIVCNMVPTYWPQLGQLMLGMADETGLEYMANMYLTPRNSQGLSEHTDNTDGLIVQADGAKVWVIKATRHPLPTRNQTTGRPWEQPTSTVVGEVLFNDTIHKGDLLLVPRGFVHYALSAEGGPSLHYTVSPVKPLSWDTSLPLLLQSFAPEAEAAAKLSSFVKRLAAQPAQAWLREDVDFFAHGIRSGQLPPAAAGTSMEAAQQLFAGDTLGQKLQTLLTLWQEQEHEEGNAGGSQLLAQLQALSPAKRSELLEAAFASADVFRNYTRKVNLHGSQCVPEPTPSRRVVRTELEFGVKQLPGGKKLSILVEEEPVARFRYTPQLFQQLKAIADLPPNTVHTCGEPPAGALAPFDVFESVCVCRVLRKYRVLKDA